MEPLEINSILIPSLNSISLSEESTIQNENISEIVQSLERRVLPSEEVLNTNTSQELDDKLNTVLTNELIKDCYQSSTENVLKLYDDFLLPSEMKLQGSAADGFLIHGWSKSDIDFLYSINIFSSSLKFKELINDPISPAHVKIEVIPNYSACRTEMEKEKLKAIIEPRDGKYFLNMNNIRQHIHDKVSKRLKKSSEYTSEIKCDNISCFRTQFNYDIFKVIAKYVTHQIGELTKFSNIILVTTDFKENVKNFFCNLSGKYIVSQYKWEEFREILKLNFHTSTLQYPMTNFSKNKISQQKIVEVLNFYFREIKGIMDGIINDKIWFWSCFKIFEDCFYFLLFLLINCGVYTIIVFGIDKSISFENQKEKNSYEKLNITEEEISKIIDIDLFSALTEPITQQEKTIENQLREFIKKNSSEMECKILSEVGPKRNFLQDFLKLRKQHSIDVTSTNKLCWLSSMIKLVAQFLENVRCLWNSYFFPDDLTSEILTIEIIPGLNFKGWPAVAADWPNRKRFWPEAEVIERIINKDFHVVFKSLNQNGYDGRLSLSEAENIMCHVMTCDQSIVYNFIKFQFKSTDSKVLKSYHLKTICLWVFESTPLENNSKNIQQIYLKSIIKMLCKALREKELPHYFFPHYNIFKELKDVEIDEIVNSFWKIDSGICKFFLELMEIKSRNPETKVRTFFKLVENLFIQSIDDTFKNINMEIND